MRKLLFRLWSDDCGALIATEWVFVATIMVLGLITGLVAVRQAILSELTEFANALTTLDQSYSFRGQKLNCSEFDQDPFGEGSGDVDIDLASTAGSWAVDFADLQRLSSTAPTANSIEQPPCD
jgi:Flp pilus assembly pilin Flp